MNTKATKVAHNRALLRPNAASREVIGCAIRVHTRVGPGGLESAVCACLDYEMKLAGLHVRRQVKLPVVYRDVKLPNAYRADFVVEECLVVEVKCVTRLLPVHFSQLLTYLKQGKLPLGLLLNFNGRRLKDGIRRVINAPEHEL